MGLVVYLGEMLEVKVRIDLRARDIGVPKQFLYTTQVVAGLQQVTGKGMTEQVRIDLGIDSLPFGPVGEASLHRPMTESLSAIAHKQGYFVAVCHTHAGHVPPLERGQRLAPDRHDAVLVAFAGDLHRRVTAIDVVNIKVDQLGEPQAG